ncbi:hypothetical protein [Hymenobacter sublimis]|uniref:Uncharacterized protein n=1 Tax=Hymenobacter sublimis TaxID=2933777 RepID=A0ABY4J5W9_9BACT|nr:hypothetical protein [Hymenobacter sublimis]UPL48215.1 hypothetical protein MWH26_13575 [Hymenobacter sublimis]
MSPKVWLLLGVVALSAVGLYYEQEVFPHVPRAVSFLCLLLVGSALLLPWFVAAAARRISRRVSGLLWRLFWLLLGVGSYVLGALLLLPGLAATVWLLVSPLE